jgi:anti-anti-sigma factor
VAPVSTYATIAISRSESDGVEIVALRGDVDLTNAGLVREAVEATSSESVVLDLTDVAFLDSMAISTFVLGQHELAIDRRALFVVSPPETPSAWTLRVTGVSEAVVCESLDAALVLAAARHATR